MLKRNLCLVIMALFVTSVTFSQVTSSSITGSVKDNADQPLVGASITAIHTPSGTQYTTISTKNGVFTLPNVRIGGPYQLKIDFVGMKSQTIDGITLLLGEPYNVNAVLGENVQIMENVIITGRARRAATDKTGAVTNIGIRQINTMPSITRSITDFTRLTPQANGNNFGGRDARYNNIQVDGANLNNNFGLSTDPLPGGGNNPISLDAIEEISVNIAPFDVRQANFTGAGISAVTRSGDNTFKGSAYGYYRDQSFNGRNVGKIQLPAFQKSATKIYGARIGGPIIKNKLFFFISAEKENRTFPGIAFRPGQSGASGSNISSTPTDSLKKLSDHLKAQYNYDPGAYDNFPSFASDNRKLLARLDWNMTKNHKLILKYSDFESTNDVQLNGTSIPGGGFGALARLANNRFSNASMAFENSNYAFKDIVHSGTLELASKFGNKFSNQFLATYTKIGATRVFNGGVFPTIDFLNLAPAAALNNQNYMHAGMDPFTYNNDVINRIYSFIDNFSYFAGKHTITAGGSYEHQSVGNMFMPASNSYYIFRSLDDFVNNQAPVYYAYTYSLVKGQKTVYSAELNIAQLGLYIQDEINVNSRLKLTFGLRADRPIYDDQPIENPEISKLTFSDKFGKATNYTTGAWPNAAWYWSPRGGFRWDMEGDKSMIIRGGTGLFTGRIPFVWLTNIPTNSSMYQVTAAVTATAALQNYKFSANPDAYASTFPIITTGSIPNNANFVVTNPNFKFPQVWRTNLAVDKNLGRGYSFSLEAIYNKDINAVWMRNANLKEPDGTFAGPDNRPRYIAPARLYGTAPTNINTAIVLENTTKGGAFMLTAQVNKAFIKGLYGSLAYTYTHAMDVTNNPGSQASSVWNSNPTQRTANTLESGYSGFAVPHRFVGSLSYRKEYLKHLATTLSFFYEASNSDVYSYTYSADLNGDGNGFDLLYIPRNSSEIIFVNSTINGVVYTPAQQWEIFNQFIENDPYLSKRRGGYAERNGAKVPFYHRLDAKILQDIFTSIGSRRHTLQISVDILNLPNFVNKDWGIRKATISRSPLAPAGPNASGVPTFRLNAANNQPISSSFQNVISTTSTWGLQLGLRYIF